MHGAIHIEFNHENPLTKHRECTQQARTDYRIQMEMIRTTSAVGMKNDGVGILVANLLEKYHSV